MLIFGIKSTETRTKQLATLPEATLITHGAHPEVFTISGGLYIANFLPGSEVGMEFKRELYEVLGKWFTKDGMLNEEYFSARCSAIRESHRKQENNYYQERE